MSVIEKNSERYIGYEYMEVKADVSRASMYIDGYSNFGWEQDDNISVQKNQNNQNIPWVREEGSIILRFKRNRKILNRAELTRLQQNFEDCMNQIAALEKSKTNTAAISSISIGLTGTVFMAGSTFAVTASPPVIWLCVLLAIPGFAGWILPYFVYKSVVSKRTRKVNPMIEDKYDEVYEICKKGSSLSGKGGGSHEEK